MATAEQALERLLQETDLQVVVDIGSGDGYHATAMREAGRQVIAISLRPPADIVADYMETEVGPVDAIWAAHVLEHMPDVGAFLRKCHQDLRDGGLLVVTVPPLKHAIVGGHVSLWNEGLLLYRLVLAGFDCSQARVGVYGYNISVMVRKSAITLPALAMDSGDIERLAEFFPVPVAQGFDGRLGSIRW